ncbi:MAG: integrase [Chitinophagia bacterium]|nr:integrase [Chitinophagia bacterium]
MGESERSDFEHYLKFERRYAPLTLEAYLSDLQQFAAYAAEHYEIQQFTQVTHFHIRSWLAGLKEQGLAARSLNRKMSAISALFTFLMKNGRASENPVRKLHAQRLPTRLPAALREQETINMLALEPMNEGFDAANAQLINALLYATGMRRSELQHLRETDIEWSRRLIRILGKGNKERLVPAGEPLLAEIRAYLAAKSELPAYNSEFLLNTPAGKPLYAMYIHRAVTGSLRQVTTASRKSPHVLRHTFATQMLNNGANIQAIQQLLGHASLASTQIYTHNDIARLKDIHKQSHPKG